MTNQTNMENFVKYVFDPIVKEKMDSLVVPDIFGVTGNIINYNTGVFGPDCENNYAVYQSSPYSIKWIKSLPSNELDWWWLSGNSHPEIINLCEKNLDKVNPKGYSNRYSYYSYEEYEEYDSDKESEIDKYTLNNIKTLIETYMQNRNRRRVSFLFFELTLRDKKIEYTNAEILELLKTSKDEDLAEYILDHLCTGFDSIFYRPSRRSRSFEDLLKISPILLKTFLKNNYFDKVNDRNCNLIYSFPILVPEILKTPERIAKIEWEYFSCNPHPEAIRMLRQNLDKVCWQTLDSNPNLDMFLCIISYHYNQMFESKNLLHAELIEVYYSPARLTRMAERLGMSFADVLNVI